MNTESTNTLFSQGLAQKQKYIIAGLLLLAMILTRGNITAHLQDASWAIFFMVGFYLRGASCGRYAFPLFFLVGFMIDLVVIDAQGGTHYCYTPAYPFLIPSYFAMWFGGRWFSNNYQESALDLFKFVGVTLFSTVVYFFISNLGFYFFAEKFEVMSLTAYAQAVAKYLPGYLATTGLYLGCVALIHLAIVHGRKLANPVHS
ncbi:MAG: hypothetical protein L3J51_00915 [Cocleimonas sp.]|nr:hypothetical protein [Cocleimonas sp.]